MGEILAYFFFVFIMFIIISSGGVLFASLGYSFAFGVPACCMAIVLVVYAFGLLNLLPAAAVVVLLLVAAAYFFSIWNTIKARKSLLSLLKSLLCPAFFILGLMLLIFAYIDYHRLVYIWDEVTHWADTVKAMYYTGVLGTHPAAYTLFPAYTPAMALFQYFFELLYSFFFPSFGFREDLLYIAFQLFILSFMLPFLSRVNIKKPVASALILLSIVLVPCVFYSPYCSLYIDVCLGILMACGMAMIFLPGEKRADYHLYIFFCSAALALLKSAGLFLSVALALVYIISLCSTDAPMRNKVLASGICLGSPLLLRLFWSIRVSMDAVGSGSSGGFGTSINIFINLLLSRDGTYRQEVYNNFGSFLRQARIGILSFSAPFWAVAAAILLMLLLVGIVSYKSRLLSGRELRLLCISNVAIFFAYLIGLLFTYIFSFNEVEALGYASFDRYVSIILLSTGMCSVLLSASFLIEAKASIITRVFLCLVMLVTIYFGNIPDNFPWLIGRQHVARSIEARSATRQVEETIKALSSEAEPCRIYMVSDGNPRFDSALLQYICRPNYVEHMWVYGGEDFTARKTPHLPAEQWSRFLVENFDFVVVFVASDDFLQNYQHLLSEPFVQGNSAVLYKVNKDTGGLERLTDFS